MRINADLSQHAVVNTTEMDWTPSPAKGVLRKMLDRDGEEFGRATSLVKFEAGCSFPEHDHPGGEEFLVLEGVFEDENGRFPAGSYVRNPVGSRHRPDAPEGCVILVKLCQFQPGDDASVAVNVREASWQQTQTPGVSEVLLHQYQDERVSMERFDAGATMPVHAHEGGEEFYVLSGACRDEHGRYPAGAWVRQPAGSKHALHSDEGCELWVKRGHLQRSD